MKSVKSVVKKMNDITISIVLLIVYISVVGVAFLIYQMQKLSIKKSIGWSKSVYLNSKDYFSSAY